MAETRIVTIDYGVLPIVKFNDYLTGDVISAIEDNEGNWYNVMKTINGQLVAHLEEEI